MEPFISFDVEFAVKMLDGVFDFSAGVKVEPSFPFVTALAVTEGINSEGEVGLPGSLGANTCPNGLSEDIYSRFEVIAFATEWLQLILYVSKGTSCLHLSSMFASSFCGTLTVQRCLSYLVWKRKEIDLVYCSTESNMHKKTGPQGPHVGKVPQYRAPDRVSGTSPRQEQERYG